MKFLKGSFFKVIFKGCDIADITMLLHLLINESKFIKNRHGFQYFQIQNFQLCLEKVER